MYKILNIVFTTFLITFLLFFVVNSNRGFDITDEGFYFISAIQPENIVGTINFFGFITNYLWRLCGESIATFRAMSVFSLFITSLFFSVSLSYFLEKNQLQKNGILNNIIPISTISITSFLYFHLWLLSASYNLLVIEGCMLLMSGLFLAFGKNKNNPFLLILGGILVGFGWLISTLSKPPTAIFLTVLILVWIFYFNKSSNKNYFLLAAITTLLVSLFLLFSINFEDIGQLRSYLSIGWNLEFVLAAHRIDQLIVSYFVSYEKFIFNYYYYIYHLPIFILFFVFFFLSQSKNLYIKYNIYTVIFSSYYFLGILALAFLGVYTNLVGSDKGNLYSFLLFATIILFLNTILSIRLRSLYDQNFNYLKPYLLITLSLFTLPLIYIIGSNAEILNGQFNAIIFIFTIWIISFHILLEGNKQKKYIIAVSCFFIIAITTKYILKAYESPYRLPTSIYYQDTEVKLLGSKGSIMLDKVSAKYVNDLKKLAIKSGWTKETPLIDLTGGSPIAFVILNANLVGAWAGGGYPGSDDFTKQAIVLSKVNPFHCWILTAPNGARAISPKVLSNIHYNFEEKFQLVGKVKTGHRQELQLLWKPKKTKNYENVYKN